MIALSSWTSHTRPAKVDRAILQRASRVEEAPPESTHPLHGQPAEGDGASLVKNRIVPDIPVGAQWTEATAHVVLPAGTKGTQGELPPMRVYDLPRGGQPFILQLSRPRWRSKDAARHNPVGALLGGMQTPETQAGRYTRRLRERCVEAWLQGEPVDVIVRRTGLRRDRIEEWIQEDLPLHSAAWRSPEFLDNLNFIGIDELFWRQQQLAVLVNLETGQLIDLLPSRSQDVIEEVLRQLLELKRQRGQDNWHPVIATDLWSPYRKAVQRVFEDRALHVADRFHVILKVQKGLREATFQLTNKAGALGATHSHLPPEQRRKAIQALVIRLHQKRRTFNTNRGRTTAGTTDPADLELLERQALQAAGLSEETLPALLKLIELGADFSDLWNCQTPTAAWAHLRSWKAHVTRWGQENHVKLPFNALLHLLETEQWAVEVINGLLPEARLPGNRLTTTAQVERINGRLRKLSRWMQDRVNAQSAQYNSRQEEQQFHRLRARALCHVNLPRKPPPVLECTLPPVIQDCACGTPAKSLEIHALGTTQRLIDLPAWGAQVAAVCPEIKVHCPTCGVNATAQEQSVNGLTHRMHAFMQARVHQDGTVRSVAHETGINERVVRTYFAQVNVPEGPRVVPPLLGIVPFMWRRTRRLLITDVVTGQPVDLIEQASPAALDAWLRPHAGAVSRFWVEDPLGLLGEEDVMGLPTYEEERRASLLASLALDRFTMVREEQKVLVTALRRYRRQQSTARLRTSGFRHLTKALLRNPRTGHPTVQDQLDAGAIDHTLQRHLNDPALSLTYAMLHLARILVQDQTADGTALNEADLFLSTHIWYRHYEEISHQYRPPIHGDERPSIPLDEMVFPVNDLNGLREFHMAFKAALRHASPANEKHVARLLDQLPNLILRRYGPDTFHGRAAQAGECLAREGHSLARSRATLTTIRRLKVFGGSDWHRLRYIVQQLPAAGQP